MRTIAFAVILLSSVLVTAQAPPAPILVSHNQVDGPFAGQSQVEDLRVFSDRRVLYEEVTSAFDQGPKHTSYDGTIEAGEIQHLTQLLTRPDVISLPRKIPPKTRPIDFFWQASLEINRPEGTQKVQVENFYPFLNLHHRVYPQALIDVECAIQNIQAKLAKRTKPTDEDNWCAELTKPNHS